MKKLFCLVAFVGLVMLSSCSYAGKDNENDVKKKISVTRSLDETEYINVTLKNVNGKLLDKTDFALVCNGRYWNGNSYIEFDMTKGRCRLYTNNSRLYEGEEVVADFIYTVKAASENCIYICPSSMNKTGFTHNGKYELGIESIYSFALYIPLYGYGQKRLEVSSILNDEICMPSGTYWKKD